MVKTEIRQFVGFFQVFSCLIAMTCELWQAFFMAFDGSRDLSKGFNLCYLLYWYGNFFL